MTTKKMKQGSGPKRRTGMTFRESGLSLAQYFGGERAPFWVAGILRRDVDDAKIADDLVHRPDAVLRMPASGSTAARFGGAAVPRWVVRVVRHTRGR